jgi:hypothetical protein
MTFFTQAGETSGGGTAHGGKALSEPRLARMLTETEPRSHLEMKAFHCWSASQARSTYASFPERSQRSTSMDQGKTARPFGKERQSDQGGAEMVSNPPGIPSAKKSLKSRDALA